MNTSRIASVACVLALACAGSAFGQEASRQADDNGSATLIEQPPPKKSVVLPRRVGKVDVSEAARRLERARLARRQGLEPHPGEVVRVGGVRTVNYRYWQRQEKLRLAVEVAQRRSQATLSRRGQSAQGSQLKVSQI